MEASFAQKMVKFTFLIVNLIVMIASFCIIGIGAWFLSYIVRYEDLFASAAMFYVIISMMSTGIFLFVLAWCGCCGAWKEAPCLLSTYLCVMVLLILGEVAGGVLCFIFASQIEESMIAGMTRSINESYGNNTAATNAIDDVQEFFECCGAVYYTDYEYSTYMQIMDEAVPKSCCKFDDKNCTSGSPGHPAFTQLVHEDGCVSKTFSFVKSHAVLLGSLYVVFTLIQVLLVVFTCFLIFAAKKRKHDQYYTVDTVEASEMRYRKGY